jgi:hypothetical protein
MTWLFDQGLRRLARAAGVLCAALGPLTAQGVGVIDYPQPGTTVSGMGMVYGWACNATRIDFDFDGALTLAAVYGVNRPDTQSICGRSNTGYTLGIYWGWLAPGAHTVRALADGVEFARAAVNVVAVGDGFVVGRTGAVTVTDFPDIGRSVELAWEQNTQSFVVQRVLPTAPSLGGTWNGANLEARSNCSSSNNNGSHGTYAQYDIGIGNGTMSIAETAVTGLQCTYSGSYSQIGQQRQASGTFTCSDGKRGTWQVTGFLVTDNEMSLKLSEQLNTTETCSINAILGGSRL